MNTDKLSDRLRNGMILNLDSRMDAILEGIGEIRSDIKTLGNESKRVSQDVRKIESRFSTCIKKTNDRIDRHLKEHREDSEIMGVYPFLKKFGRRNWKILFSGFLLVQIALAMLVFKYGFEKILNFLLR